MSLSPKTDSALLEAAVRLARKVPVFPCTRDKKPRIKNGLKSATTDEAQARTWWEMWPDASIGMPTGTVSGKLVLDVDPRNGGDKCLDVLLEKYGQLPETLHAITGGGGDHYFFEVHGLTIRSGILAPGIDIKAEGGYVILPPSPHPSGNRYEWANNAKVSDMPAWLEALLKERGKKSTPENNGTGRKKIEAGNRNNWLARCAGRYRRNGDTPEVIFQKIKLDYERCEHEPPMGDNELRAIANSIGRYPPEPERTSLPRTSNHPDPPKQAVPEGQQAIPGRLPITEVSNAERLVALFQEEIRYASDRRIWCVWNGNHWVINDLMGVNRRMQEVARGVYFEAGHAPSEELRKVLAKWAQKSESHSVQSGSMDEARCKVEVRTFSKVFDTHPLLLNVSNGTRDLPAEEFRAQRREDFITKKVDIEYQPEAECPQLNRFLAETFGGSVPLIGYATRLAGYFLTGLTTEQKWWMFHGPTASGKSTFIKILHGLLGPYALALPENYFLISKHDTTDFITANLAGVRLATCVETNEGRRLNVARIKAITGEDMISAQLKYQNYFEFQPQCKLVLVTNFPPHVPAGDEALWRRLKVLPFPFTVPREKRIPGLAEKLLGEEGAGILNWAIAGYRDLRMNGLQEPEAVTNAIAQYRSSEDLIQNFLQECFGQDPSWRETRKDVYSAYVKWSKEGNLQPMAKKKLASELQRLGIRGDPGDRFWLNIRLRERLI
jgi:putative DNA primase/helicase